MDVIIEENMCRDKVYACWLGKNIGGTLGGPWEGQKHVHDLDFYDPVPDEPQPNDDLDFQLVWLKMLEDRGPDICLGDFAEYWQRYLAAYPWNEYGFCMRNLERGLQPPVSGWFENYFVDEMGSPIRSEIWACICPADPQRAAAMAWMDSAMDHAGGEGMNGEMFWAAVESAAFVLDDPEELIRIGLAMVPPACRIARAIRESVWCYENGICWSDARERLERVFGHVQPCDAAVNHGFTVLGWLYGEDFGDQLCKAVNCGYDTDCTGATLGSVLGIIGGTEYIPEKWIDPIGEGIALHKFTGDCNAPDTIEDFTERTLAVAEQMAETREAMVSLGNQMILPNDLIGWLRRNDDALACLRQDVRSAFAREEDLQIVLYYNGEPVFRPGVSRILSVECQQDMAPADAEVELVLPEAWELVDEEQTSYEKRFLLMPPEVADRNIVEVKAYLGGKAYSSEFMVLGPGEARGFPATQNVETCPRCRARKNACICSD
ncbi:MAG: ADP-ribosylglycohydrolase family protein [Candidatus Brocadiia bacterium]